MARKPKEKVEFLRTEKKIIKYKDANGNWIEQEVNVKVYAPKKVTQDTSLVEEILGETPYESDIDSGDF